MDASLFAMAQSRVAEQLETKAALMQGIGAAGLKRVAKTVAIGLAAAASFTAGAMTPAQMIDYQQRQALSMQSQRMQADLNRRMQQERQADNMRQQVANQAINALVSGLATQARSALQPTPQVRYVQAQPAYQPQYVQQPQYAQRQQPQYVAQPARFVPPAVAQSQTYLPSELGMPSEFTKVAQQTATRMVAPGRIPMDLRDNTRVSQDLTRAIDGLESALESHEIRTAALLDIRERSLAASQTAVHRDFVQSAMRVDRAIEDYMRASNGAARMNLNTEPFNRMVAEAVLNKYVSEQQVRFGADDRQPTPSYRR